jgi:hypothetical protein
MEKKKAQALKDQRMGRRNQQTLEAKMENVVKAPRDPKAAERQKK